MEWELVASEGWVCSCSHLAGRDDLQRAEGDLEVGRVGLELVEGLGNVLLQLGRALSRGAVGGDLVEGAHLGDCAVMRRERCGWRGGEVVACGLRGGNFGGCGLGFSCPDLWECGFMPEAHMGRNTYYVLRSAFAVSPSRELQ